MAVTSVNGVAVSSPVFSTLPVGATANGCSAVGAQVSCNLPLDVPVGNDIITVQTLDSSMSNVLGSANAPATVVQNAANVVTLSVGGTVANLQLYLSQTSFTTGSAANALVVVVPLDASGAVIVNPGSYTTPINVTSSDTSGSFTLKLNGSASGTSATLTSPSDQVVLSYSGTGVATTNVTATSGSASATANARSGAAAGLTVNPSGFVFAGTSATPGTLTVTGGTPPYTVTSADSSVASVSGSGPYTITPTGFGSNGLGSTTINVTDSASTPAMVTASVTVQPVAITIAAVCGTGVMASNCSNTAVTFPQYSSTGYSMYVNATLTLTGGIGTYAYQWLSSGLTTSAYAQASQAGSTITITPKGSGNDVLLVTSGSRTATYSVLTTTASPLASLLPSAFGMLVMKNSGGVGKSFSFVLPTVIGSATQFMPTPDDNFVGDPPATTITATPMTPQVGSFTFGDSLGNSITLPVTIFGVSFQTYAGTGITSSAEPPPTADEQFFATGQSDTVTVSGNGGYISVSSSNPSVVSTSVQSTNTFTATAGQAGFSTITITDGSNGASTSYRASVTTTTIPIASRARER